LARDQHREPGTCDPQPNLDRTKAPTTGTTASTVAHVPLMRLGNQKVRDRLIERRGWAAAVDGLTKARRQRVDPFGKAAVAGAGRLGAPVAARNQDHARSPG
jgi:hypothetical protein